MKKKFAYVCIAIAVLIWSTTYLLSKDVLADVKPGVIIFVRSFLATVFLSFFCIGKIKGRSKKTWLINIATGVVVAFAYLTQVEGLQYTTPAKNGFLENTYCIVVPFIVWILERKRPSIKSWICIAVCFIGVIFISLDSLRGGLNAKEIGGDLLSGLAGVLFGVNIALTGRFVKDENPIVYTTCQFFVVAVVSGVYLLIRKAFGSYELAMNISPKTVWVLIYLGIGAMAVSWLCRNYAQKYVSSVTVAVIFPFSAVIGSVLSIAFGQDTFTAELVVGGVLMMLAIIGDGVFSNKKQNELPLENEEVTA